eukprot:1685782-Pyramimonas_sp.AAC.1
MGMFSLPFCDWSPTYLRAAVHGVDLQRGREFALPLPLGVPPHREDGPLVGHQLQPSHGGQGGGGGEGSARRRGGDGGVGSGGGVAYPGPAQRAHVERVNVGAVLAAGVAADDVHDAVDLHRAVVVPGMGELALHLGGHPLAIRGHRLLEGAQEGPVRGAGSACGMGVCVGGGVTVVAVGGGHNLLRSHRSCRCRCLYDHLDLCRISV